LNNPLSSRINFGEKMEPDPISEAALQALRSENPLEAKEVLEKLIGEHPEKLDLRHSLAVVLLNMGESAAAHILCQDTIRMCFESRDDMATTMLTPLFLADAEACEGLNNAQEAEKNYKKILETEEGHPYARQRYAYLLFASGRIKEGLTQMQAYVEEGHDEPDALTAHEKLIASIQSFQRNDVHPKEFLVAHREAYVQEFSRVAQDLEKEGWYVEAARMNRSDDGTFVPIIPEGSPSYAAMRVDVVNPKTGQPGRIGEGPYYVGLADYAILVQSPFVDSWPGRPFPVYVSSRCAWNHFSIQIRVFNESSLDILDSYIGDWYESGFHGSYGAPGKEGMFHEIYNFERVDENRISFYVDMGRARLEAVEDFLNRLEVFHQQYFIDAVLFGDGFLPTIDQK
jgi:tetratricopeptide (TPR) repeat protein